MADELECCAVVVQSRSFSCCGIVLDSNAGIIITVGSIANSSWRQDNDKSSRNHASGLGNVQALRPLQDQNVPVEVLVKKINRAKSDDFFTLDGRVVALWRNEKISHICQKMFPSMEWTFEEDTSNGRSNGFQDSREAALCLADFALIEVKNLHAYLSTNVSLNIHKEIVTNGEPVTIIGTPFGSECCSVFFNSVSKGIVSNIIGPNREMILTDARCVPGCEGCPVFLDSNSLPGKIGSVYGIVVAPFCWRSGEWIGLTLVCSISHILKNLLETNILTKVKRIQSSLEFGLKMNEKSITAAPGFSLCSFDHSCNQELVQRSCNKEQVSLICDVLGKSKPCVMLVECGTTWGSGIVTDVKDGFVVTCRHILTEGGILESRKMSTSMSSCNYKNRTNVPLRIHDVLSHSVYDNVEIVFATTQDCALDFALLRVKNHNFKAAIKFRMCNNEYNQQNNPFHNMFNKGEEILAIGHSLFGSQLSNGPCITSGILSNITYVNGLPAMLQSTAVVHCGGSGGAIFSRSTGELLGMVTSNTKDANSSSSFPHINFSIPGNLILRLIALSMSDSETRDDYLKNLTSGIDNAWHLNSTRNPKSKL